MSFSMKVKALIIISVAFNMNVTFCEEYKCNLNDCLYEVQELLKNENDAERVCGRMKKVTNCFWNCLEDTAYGNVDIYSGLKRLSSQEKCEELSESIAYHGECLLKNKYPIMACFLKSANLLLASNLSDQSSLTCKRLLTAQSCSDIVFTNCGDSGVELMMSLQETLLRTLFQSACAGLQGIVHDLQVVFPHGNKFVKLAHCLEPNDNEVSRCFKEHIQVTTTTVADCRSLDEFYRCVAVALQGSCESKIITSTKPFFESMFSFLGGRQCQNFDSTSVSSRKFTTPSTKSTSSSDKIFKSVLTDEMLKPGNSSSKYQKDQDAAANTDLVKKNDSIGNIDLHMLVYKVTVFDNSLASTHYVSHITCHLAISILIQKLSR